MVEHGKAGLNVNHGEAGEYRGEEASQYERQVAEHDWHGHEIMFGLMYEFVNPGESLLDIGIGTGLSSLLFHKAGLQIAGFDNSTDMLKGCESKAFTGPIIQHDLRNVPFPYEAGSFNHILSLGVLNFFSDLAPVFEEAARIIEPKGVFGFTIEERKAGQEARYAIRVTGESDQGKEQYEVAMFRHSDDQVRSLLAGVGFETLKDYEFLSARYPEQGIEVYLKIYVARKSGG
jgi:predicted TPR repeat methyltransferase